MPLESRARVLREVVDERQVIQRGLHRTVAHERRQRRKTRLNIDAGAVPAEECVDREGESEIVHARNTFGGGANAGSEE